MTEMIKYLVLKELLKKVKEENDRYAKFESLSRWGAKEPYEGDEVQKYDIYKLEEELKELEATLLKPYEY